jgi:NTE family protein
MAHIGVLKALERGGGAPRLVAGTSYGAIIAALYALCGNALEVERITRSQDVAEVWRQAIDFGLHRGAVIEGRRLADWLDRKYFFGATFADVTVPLAVACTDLRTRTLVTLESGSIAQAVRASCALPGIFAPVEWEGRTLIDGGFLEPIPFPSLQAARGAVRLGVQAGVDVRRSRVVRTIRRFNGSAAGRAFRRRADSVSGVGAIGQMLRGVSISLSSYSRGVRVPTGATLLRVDPGIAWWDFHRSPGAIAAGERAMEQLLSESDLLSAALEPAPGLALAHESRSRR